MKHCAQMWHSWLDTETRGPIFPSLFFVLTIPQLSPPFLIPPLPRDVVHVTLSFSLYQLYCDDNLSAVLAQLCFSFTMRTQLSMHFIASGSHLAVQRVLRALRQSLACLVRWLQYLTGTNEEITGSVDKVSHLGIELKLESFSHMLPLSVVTTIFFSFKLFYKCFVCRLFINFSKDQNMYT